MILLSQSTGRLHLVEEPEGPVGCGGPPRAGLDEYLDVMSGHTVHLPPSDVRGKLIADRELRAVLLAAGVSGLRPVGDPLPRADELPLAGNLHNPSWLAVAVGGQCASHCSFCFTEFIRRDPHLDAATIERILVLAAQIDSIESVVFTGGEPTIRPDLIELITRAAALGFPRIEVQTNGHRLADLSYLRGLVDAGVTSVLLSLHGSAPTTHDAIVGVPGSFDLVTQALRNLVDEGAPTAVNYVVCRQNIAECDAFVRLVDAIDEDTPIRLSFPIVEGAAWTNAASLVTSLPAFAEVVAGARAIRAGRGRIEAANVPPCVAAAAGTPPAYTVAQRRTVLLASPFYRGLHDRGEVLAKVSSCDGCDAAGDCDGLQLPYLMRFPDAYDHVSPLGSAPAPIHDHRSQSVRSG